MRVDLAERVQIRRFDGVLEYRPDLDGNRGGAVADRQAAQQPGMVRSREQQRGRADVGTDGMRPVQSERVNGMRDELAHRGRFEEFVAALRVPEARQVDRDQMGVLGQARPHLLEGVEAFGPRAEEYRRYFPRLALGIADRQAVDLSCLCLDERAA